MATSGTYSFMMVRDDLIGAAARLTGRFDPYDAIPPTDIANIAQALNILVKELVTEGLPLWKVETLPVPMIAGQAVYNLSTLSNSTLPLRILQAFLRDSAGNDVEIMIESRYDYNRLGQKTSQSVPNQGYYDPQLAGGTLTLYNVPQDSTRTLYVVMQYQCQDFNSSTDNPDFPQEAYRMLKWCLADEIAVEYNTPPAKRGEIAGRALTLRKDFFEKQQEQVSVFITPTVRGERGN